VKPKVTKVDVWAATIQDRAGGLAEKLAPLAAAGANFEFIIARRAPDQPGNAVVFVTPVKGAKQVKAAKAAGFHTTDTLHSVRVEGGDKAGLGAKMTKALAEADISLRGLSAAAFGKKFVCYLALDSAAAAAKAASIVKKLS